MEKKVNNTSAINNILSAEITASTRAKTLKFSLFHFAVSSSYNYLVKLLGKTRKAYFLKTVKI